MAITNGTFDTDLNGWTVSDPNRIVWEDGHVLFQNPNYSSPVYMNQTFIVEKGAISFDWIVLGACSCFHKSWKIYVDNNLVQTKSFGPSSCGCIGTVSGKEKINVLKYIGKTIKFEITTDAADSYGFNMQLDNVSSEDVIGITNGHFDQEFNGWEITGTVELRSCYGFSCSGNVARIRSGSILQQYFIIDKCILKFSWMTSDPGTQGYNLYIDDSLFASNVLPGYSNGIEIIDVGSRVGHIAMISFYCDAYRLYIDDVETVTDPFSISIISYPSGAEIYIDDNGTGQTTGNVPTMVTTGLTEGQHVVTLKLAGYTDYVEIVNIVKCQISYVTAIFEGCIAFVTIPSGAKICIDNTDTGQVTPYTFCGYNIGDSRTYTLLLKDYRTKNDIVTPGSGKGIFINEVLVYNTGSAHFDTAPSGAKIIIDSIDTGKTTPDIINDISIGSHTFVLSLDGYYDLSGSFRSIVDKTKEITEALQEISGLVNGKFDNDLNGWTITVPDTNIGNVVWDNGRAHLFGHDTGLTAYQDFVITEDALVFDYTIGEIRYTCDAGWNVTIDPGTPEANTIASWCGRYGGRFEADVSLYKNKNARLLFYLNCNRRFSWGSDTWIDNVGNVPKPIRTIAVDTFCTKLPTCPTTEQIIEKCYADIYINGILKGTNPIIMDNLSIGNYSYLIRNKGYLNVDTNSEDITGNVSFSQGIPTHIYIDGIYIPGEKISGESCVYIESDPPGANIFIDGMDSGKITPDTICSISLGNHSYELKSLNHTVYKGTFILGSQFGEYISVVITGSVYFTSIPSGARIYIDGNDLGINTPYLAKGIKAGYHQYTLVRPYYYDYTKTIYVIGEP